MEVQQGLICLTELKHLRADTTVNRTDGKKDRVRGRWMNQINAGPQASARPHASAWP